MLPSAPRRSPMLQRSGRVLMSIAEAPGCSASRDRHEVFTGGEGTRTRLGPPGSDEPSSAVVGKTALLGRALRSSTCPLTGSTTTNSRELFRELRKDAYAPELAPRQEKKLGDFMYFAHKLVHRFSTGLGAGCPRFLGANLWRVAGGGATWPQMCTVHSV